MTIFRPYTVLSAVAFLLAGLHVYQTKHEAALLDRELRGIARQVEGAEARTQTLQAEWAWLNEPERLRNVAQRHLPALEAMQPTQFVRAAEAERRLPGALAYAGPTALFAAREPATPAGNSSFALLPRATAPVQVAAVVTATVPQPAAVVPAPVAAAPVAAAPATAAPATLIPATAAAPARVATPAPAAAVPAAVPAMTRLALPATPPRVAEPPRPAESRPVEPRPVELAARPAPRPAIRPVPAELAALPPIAAPPRQPPVTQLATASLPRPAIEAPRGYAMPSLLGGSSLGGGGRPLLPPPVPFGSAGAATLGNGALPR